MRKQEEDTWQLKLVPAAVWSGNKRVKNEFSSPITSFSVPIYIICPIRKDFR